MPNFSSLLRRCVLVVDGSFEPYPYNPAGPSLPSLEALDERIGQKAVGILFSILSACLLTHLSRLAPYFSTALVARSVAASSYVAVKISWRWCWFRHSLRSD